MLKLMENAAQIKQTLTTRTQAFSDKLELIAASIVGTRFTAPKGLKSALSFLRQLTCSRQHGKNIAADTWYNPVKSATKNTIFSDFI